MPARGREAHAPTRHEPPPAHPARPPPASGRPGLAGVESPAFLGPIPVEHDMNPDRLTAQIRRGESDAVATAQAMGNGSIRIEMLPSVGERIRRHVDDTADQRAVQHQLSAGTIDGGVEHGALLHSRCLSLSINAKGRDCGLLQNTFSPQLRVR